MLQNELNLNLKIWCLEYVSRACVTEIIVSLSVLSILLTVTVAIYTYLITDQMYGVNKLVHSMLFHEITVSE